MFNDATGFKRIFLKVGYTDLRSGIDRLADTVRSYLGENAIEPDTLYLFCGRRTDRIKGLVWENDGYLLLYKRLEAGKFQWPRTESEVRSITSLCSHLYIVFSLILFFIYLVCIFHIFHDIHTSIAVCVDIL